MLKWFAAVRNDPRVIRINIAHRVDTFVTVVFLVVFPNGTQLHCDKTSSDVAIIGRDVLEIAQTVTGQFRVQCLA